jgi:hypothetical protein
MNVNYIVYILIQEPGSSVIIVSDYGLDDRAIGVRSPAGAWIFPLTSVSEADELYLLSLQALLQ